MRRRLSVGGPGTLPGYDFRRAWRVHPDVLTCGGTVLPGAPALCDRVMLFQAEYRSDFGVRWVRNDARDDWWRPGFNRHASWVLFADAGRGWRVGGGPRPLADACVDKGLAAVPLPDEMCETLGERAPLLWDWVGNPVDQSILAGAPVSGAQMLEMMAPSPHFDLLIANVGEDWILGRPDAEARLGRLGGA